MKKRHRIEFNGSFIIKKEGLKKLYKNIIKFYSDIKIEGKTITGENLYFTDFDELLNYENYEDNKLTEIKLHFKKAIDEYCEINFSSIYFESIFSNYYTIVSNNLDDYEKIKNDIQKILKNEFKQWYSFLNLNLIYGIINYFLVLFIFIYLIIFFDIEIKGTANSVSTLIFPIIIIFFPFYQKTWEQLFPKMIFGIGKQKEKILYHEKVRNIIFVIIILGLLIGVLGSYIFNKIFN